MLRHGGRLRRVARAILIPVLVGGAILVVAAGRPMAAIIAEQHFFRIGAGAVDHPAFGVAGLIASGISSPPGGLTCEHGGSCGVPGLIAVAQSVPDPAERLREVASGELDVALVSSDEMLPVTPKKMPLPKELAQIRSLATLYAEPIQLIVRADSSYQSPNDLKRQAVAISAPLERQAKLLALWSKPLRFGAQPAYLTTLEDELKALADGRIEAVLTIGAGPVQAVADQAARSKLRLLPITGNEQPGMSQPCLVSVRIDASAYPGIAETPTLALTTQLVTRQDAPPDLVYGVTKALWNGATRKLLAGGSVEAQDVRIDNSILGLAVGLHPGATRYYREAGVLRTTALAETPK